MLNKIIKNLKIGNYRIVYQEHCNCNFDWRLENGELVCDTFNNGGCFHENVLIMDDLAGQRDHTLTVSKAGVIASYDAYYGITVPISNIPYLAIKDGVEQVIINAIKNCNAYEKLTDGINTPDANNYLHDRRKREALVKWLNDNKHLRPYVYYPCVYPNDYVCGLLVLPGYYRKIDLLWVPVHWYSKSAEEWADMLLQKDMGGTRYDNGFELVNELYEIDYGWYNHRADMTVSHDAIRYFFVDLQSANNFLNTREPGGINCYDLNRLTVDYDGMIAETDCIATKWGPEAAKEARKNGNRLEW